MAADARGTYTTMLLPRARASAPPLGSAVSSVTQSPLATAGAKWGGFQPLVTYTILPTPPFSGGGGSNIVVADSNGDGCPDVATSGGANGTVAVLLNNCEGVFRTPIVYNMGTDSPLCESLPCSYVEGLVVGDFQGAGALDLIASGEFEYGAGYTLLRGSGDGTFDVGKSNIATEWASSLVAADLRRDGKLDMAGTSGSGSYDGAIIMLSHSDGTFDPPVFYNWASPSVPGNSGTNSIVVADLNGDGIPDLVLTNSNIGTLSLLFGNGDGTFQPAVQLAVNPAGNNRDFASASPQLVAAGDVNGDGHPDLVVAGQVNDLTVTDPSHGGGLAPEFSSITVFLNNGDGTFGPPINYITNAYNDGFVLADIDGDSKLDVITSGENGILEILLGNGDGTFRAPIGFPGAPWPIAVADLNRDGIPDVVGGGGVWLGVELSVAASGQPAAGPVVSAVVDSAAFRDVVPSGGFLTIFGQNFTTVTSDWTSAMPDGRTLPLSLGGVSVQIDGQQCFVEYVSPTQLNVLTPPDERFGALPQAVPVTVTTPQGTASTIFQGTTNTYPYFPGAASAALWISEIAPGFFSSWLEGKQYPVALYDNTAVLVGPPGAFAGATSRPAKPGDSIDLFLGGLGPTNPVYPVGQVLTTDYPVADISQLKVTIGKIPATVSYAAMVEAGLFKVNFQVPPGIANGELPIVLTMMGKSTPPGAVLPFQSQ